MAAPEQQLNPLTISDLPRTTCDRWALRLHLLGCLLLIVCLPLSYFVHWGYFLGALVPFWLCQFFAAALWAPRFRAIRKHIEERLAARGQVSPDVWGPDPRRRAMLIEVLGYVPRSWPSQNFVPEDPLSIVFGVHTDWAISLKAILDVVESRSGERPTLGQVEQFLKVCLGEFVDDLLAHEARPNKPPTDYSQFARFPESGS
jgi:hypothetical protein